MMVVTACAKSDTGTHAMWETYRFPWPFQLPFRFFMERSCLYCGAKR